LIAICTLTWLAGPADSVERRTVEIASKSGVHAFKVDLAATDRERGRGLMFHRSLPQSYGMLFDFKRDQDVDMWMKNTYVPLDMIFIRSDGGILRIADNTRPLSERLIPSGGPVRAVLEVAGGTARKLGIAPGDRVVSPIFRR
jgi:uncharacterized protein